MRSISRNNNTVSTIVGDELIILEFERGEYFGLQEAAKQLWIDLESGPSTDEDIISHWLVIFGNAEKELRGLLEQTISNLEDKGLLSIESPND